MSGLGRALEQTFRKESGRVLATLIHSLGGDFERAEDALQDALSAAALSWPQSGLPNNPAAWLTTTARRKALDSLRKERTAQAKQAELTALVALEAELSSKEAHEIPDERLRLIFTCCHPSLALPAQVALTLRTLGGLRTEEIARAFFVPATTMAQRLVRAKKKIKAARIPYVVPQPEDMPERLEAVLAAVYLIFNEGYLATGSKSVLRLDLCQEALRLAGLLVELLPGQSEARGLFALMLLHHARAPARMTANNDLVLLEDQDRTLWDQSQIAVGLAQLDLGFAAVRHPKDDEGRVSSPGPYVLQAAIAALHAQAQTAELTDWTQIALLYDELHRVLPTDVVALNRVVAWSFARGPDLGWELLKRLAPHPGFEAYPSFHLVRADLCRRRDDLEGARRAYQRALAVSDNDAMTRSIEARLVALNPD